MSFTDHRCVEISCDDCGATYDRDEGTMHFPDRDAAAADAEAGGWATAGRRALCPECADDRACALLGHCWSAWRDHVSGVHVGRVRVCHLCGEPEWDPPVHGQIALDDRPEEDT